MSDAELRALNAYVIRMEALAKKYECTITIINGDRCRADEPKTEVESR